MRMLQWIVLCVLVTGCSRPSTETGVAFNVDGAPTVQFSVPDMMCEDSCAVKAKEILSRMPGAKDVQVDFATKTAKVAIEEGEFDANAAIAALVDHSFVHTSLKSGATDIKSAADTDSAATRPAPAH